VKTADQSNNELISRNFVKVRVYYCFSKLWHNVPSLIKFSPWGEANGLASEVKGDLGGLAKRFGMGRINDGEEALRLAEAAKRGCVWWPRGKCVVCSQAAKCLVVVVVPPGALSIWYVVLNQFEVADGTLKSVADAAEPFNGGLMRPPSSRGGRPPWPPFIPHWLVTGSEKSMPKATKGRVRVVMAHFRTLHF